MKSLNRYRLLKASSLLESIIAIVIISICSLVSLTIYLNVISQNVPIAFYKAKHKIEKLTELTSKNRLYENESFTFSDYSIYKSVEIKKVKGVVEIEYKIETANKLYIIPKLIPYFLDEE